MGMCVFTSVCMLDLCILLQVSDTGRYRHWGMPRSLRAPKNFQGISFFVFAASLPTGFSTSVVLSRLMLLSKPGLNILLHLAQDPCGIGIGHEFTCTAMGCQARAFGLRAAPSPEEDVGSRLLKISWTMTLHDTSTSQTCIKV